MAELCLKTEKMEPRWYQTAVLDHYTKTSGSFLVHLPTGAGKSYVMVLLAKHCVERQQNVVMIVKGKSLVHQFSRLLSEEGIDHGIVQASVLDTSKRVQVCSVDTLIRREQRPEADLLIVDEAHKALSSGFETVLSYYKCRIVSFTATPYHNQGFKALADEIIRPTDFRGLMISGHLVTPVYFGKSNNIDLSSVGIRSGEYKEEDLNRVYGSSKIYGDLVENFKTYAKDRPTLIFAVSIQHSLKINETLNAQGIPTAHIDQSTPTQKRLEIIEELRLGKIKAISNVQVLTTGVDIPCVSAIMLLRPTKSRSLFIQMVGRGSRPSPGKNNFYVIDMAKNLERHGFIEDAPLGNLAPKRISDSLPAPVKTCKVCSSVASVGTKTCQHCETDFPLKKEPRTILNVPSSLREIKDQDQFYIETIKGFAKEVKRRKQKPGRVYYMAVKSFGEELAKKYLPYNSKDDIFNNYLGIN